MIRKNIVKEVLAKIEAEKGVVTPREVLQRARPADSPIHDLFDWSNAAAAEKYRLWQARQIIRTVTIEYGGKQTDAYWNAKIQIENVQVNGYFSTEKVVNDKALYKQVLHDAVTELVYWQKKYKQLEELQDVIDTKKLESVGEL